ncbi:MAG: hypothetical protein V3R84_10530 [Acidimicrobiia bacterium]
MDERFRSILGHAELRSLPISPIWTLTSGGRELAKLRRFPRQHISSVKLADDTVWTLVPSGWGVVRAMDGDTEIARITRRSWWGRRWEIESVGFAVGLVSRARPRRWSMTIGGQPIAEVRGSAFSYNRVYFDASLNIPVSAVVLAWQVIARPWEQAAHPIELVPGQVRRATTS